MGATRVKKEKNPFSPFFPQTRLKMTEKKMLSIEDDDEEDDQDETFLERIAGLSEMFPESLRNATCGFFNLSFQSAKTLFHLGRTAAWVFVSSATIIVLPAMFESERAQAQEQQLQQQGQILLGPNAAVSGQSGMLPGVMPGVGSAPPRV